MAPLQRSQYSPGLIPASPPGGSLLPGPNRPAGRRRPGIDRTTFCKKRCLVVALLLFLAGSAGLVRTGQAMSGSRWNSVPSSGSVHRWEVKTWKDQSVQCDIYLDGDNPPGEQDFAAYCGESLYQKWVTTPPCADLLSKGDSSKCDGVFLVDMGKATLSYNKMVPLPSAQVSFAVSNCTIGQWCDQKPILHFAAKEPLDGFRIEEIHIQDGQRDTVCSRTNGCDFYLPLTGDQGIWLEYWADSSYGDETEPKTLHLRNIYRQDNNGQYRLEVLSPDYVQDFASLQWDAFPAQDDPDELFYLPVTSPGQLATHNHLFYLSGKLINSGKVSVSGCAQGLLSDGMASTCGEELAYNAAQAWQNQYDQPIYQAAQDQSIPAKILKGIITQESQFWSDNGIPYEYGLGCVSENGVDALLVTDVSSFLSVCRPEYGDDACAAGYYNLTSDQRAVLRGLVLRSIGSDQEIDLLARVLKAETVQVGQLISDQTGKEPGQVTSYEDLWDLAIANYHVGSGCIKDGLQKIDDAGEDINFANFCKENTSCPSACDFTQNVIDFMH